MTPPRDVPKDRLAPPSGTPRPLARVLLVLSGAVFFAAYAAMRLKIEPIHSQYYVFAWWPAILFTESFLALRGGDSTLFARPRRFLAECALSVPLWLVFEAANFRLANWHYTNVPPELPLRWAGYCVSFATVLPGLFAAGRLFEHLGLFRGLERVPPLRRPERLDGPFFAIGAASLLLSLALPRYCFPLVWGAFIFLCEPANRRLSAPCILSDWERGSLRRAGCLLAAGALCGFLWEFWNSGAGAQWHYTIPFVGVWKVFEMPILGFIGFPPFALECFAMTALFFSALGRLEGRIGRRAARALAILALALFSAAVFSGMDHFTVASWAKRG